MLIYPMKLKLAVICDNAFTDRDGHLSIIQTFNQIFIPQDHTTYPRLTIVATYELTGETPGSDFNQKFEARIIDPGDKTVAAMTVSKHGIAPGETEMNFIGYFINVPLSAGNYQIALNFADTPEHLLPFSVKTIPASPAGQS